MQIQYVFLFYFRLKDTLQVVAVLVLHHRGGPARSHSQSLSALSEPWGRLGRGRRWPLSATVTEDAPVGAGHVILRWFLRL